MYADMGDNERAIEKLKTATEKAPNERTLAALAEAYEHVRDYKNAVEALKRALALSPDSGRLQLALANDLMQSGQLDEALKIYQQLADDDPHDADLRLRMAEIYRSRHDLAKAREQLNQAKQIDPGDMGVSYEEANLLEAEGKSDEAIAKLKGMLDDSRAAQLLGRPGRQPRHAAEAARIPLPQLRAVAAGGGRVPPGRVPG